MKKIFGMVVLCCTLMVALGSISGCPKPTGKTTGGTATTTPAMGGTDKVTSTPTVAATSEKMTGATGMTSAKVTSTGTGTGTSK